MSMNDPYGKYFENQVMTASPSKLLIMSYDAAVRFGRLAQENMKARNIEEQSRYIGKVQDLILNLMGALDPKYDRQLAANLEALYTYMFDRLTHANFYDDQKVLDEVVSILSELRETWMEADKSKNIGMSASSVFGRAA